MKRASPPRSSRAEALQVIQAARSSRSALHGNEVLEPADAHTDPVEFAFDRVGREGRVCRICVDAGDLLHDVKVEPKVGSDEQVLRTGRIEGELVGLKVAEADVPCIEVGKQRGEAP
jgi:hypothetical protein